ncbi:hypothetical protein [Kiloniella laminariae]|uniref:hypothetical protein n=1 Tax=Kiloniella laminariae TaxID=454162 RepID=UPI00037B3C11|nr:hypothetical protein [Kiloniella laminariae]
MAIQQKYPVYEGLIDLLASKGIVFGTAKPHTYTYFSVSGGSSQSSVLRLKSSEGIHNLDYKTRDVSSGDWVRCGTDISDPEQMRLILENIGSKPLKTFLKSFRTWENDFLRIDIVAVDDLFSVLEAKFLNENAEKVKVFLESLGFDTSKPDSRSVIEIYLDMNVGDDQ